MNFRKQVEMGTPAFSRDESVEDLVVDLASVCQTFQVVVDPDGVMVGELGTDLSVIFRV